MLNCEGTPAQRGRSYGEQLKDSIRENVKILVHRVGHPSLPRGEAHFQSWMRRQESLMAKHWPWLLEEIRGVAAGCGEEYEDILLLNLRAWQYDLYNKPPAGGCSSLAVTLSDGAVVCTGALDDPPQLYCGPVRFVPEEGFRSVSFPITGTSWGNRGMNSRGLSVGISSQSLPGLKSLPNAVNQDIAMRVILQTCATVGEVREFCRAFPFTMNMVCVDAAGGIFCAHQTAGGFFEVPAPEGWCCLTNHVCDDGMRYRLMSLGVKEFPESPTTRARRGKLVEFCRERNGSCSAEEVLSLIGRRDDGDPGTIHNGGTVCLTFSSTKEPHTLRVLQPSEASGSNVFESLEV